MSNVYTWNYLFCNALVHVIYSGVSGQCFHTIYLYMGVCVCVCVCVFDVVF